MRFTRGRGARTALALATLCACFGTDALRAVEPKAPALNQLVVLDPGVDEKGLPAVHVDDEGQVEIPPTIHVHRYYYSGDLEYQAQILQGGPTIVVANHPKTNEKMYVDVMLPAGAPVIAYSKHSITYVYEDQRIAVVFSHLLPKHVMVKHVMVKHLPGRGIARNLRDTSEELKAKTKKKKSQSAIVRELKNAAEGTGKVVKGLGGVASKVGETVIQRARGLAGLIPGVKPLQSIADQIPEEQDLEEIKQAGLKQAAEQTKFVPTLR